MRYSLAQMAARARPSLRRRGSLVLRDIIPPAVLATDLFQASYRPIVTLWRDRIPAIMAAYEQTLSTMTTDSPADVQREIEAGESAFSRILLELTAGLRRWALRTETWTRGRFRGAVLSATSVDVGTLVGPEDVRDTLETYIGWNVDLIRDVNAEAKKRFSTAIFKGLTERRTAREVAAELREAVDMTRKRSINIASDQLSKLSAELAEERRREAGLSVWQWRHSRKRHPRLDHQARDGNYYSEDKSLVGTVIDGKTVMEPPPRDDYPSRRPFCGCKSSGVLVFD